MNGHLLALLLVFAPGFAARLQAKTAAMTSYLYIKEDDGQYAGEGTALLKEFSGAPEAAKAARRRALESLGETIRVQVTSRTTEKIQLKDGKVSEEIRSEGESKVDLSLENVRYLELADFPEPGKLTVLAHVSKEDYRRQLAGKGVPLYVPENGMRVSAGFSGGGWIAENGDPSPLVGVDFFWRGLALGVEMNEVRMGSQGPFLTSANAGLLVRAWTFSFGHDWTPWRWKLQPFIPLRLKYELAAADPYVAHLFGASAGLGLRYWPTDSFSFDVSLRQNMALNRSSLLNGAGAPYNDPKTGSPLLIGLDNMALHVGLLWSGF
jgi:hypothetical protein